MINLIVTLVFSTSLPGPDNHTNPDLDGHNTMFDVYGSFINLNILNSSHSRQYSVLQWRHLQICKAASITRFFFQGHVSWVFDNLANPMMILPGDSRYNSALSLLKSDYCRQSYTASGPHVPM